MCPPPLQLERRGAGQKTPLLRSMKVVSDQACRILRLFGRDIAHVDVTVGPEQEYFLIKKEDYERREDLILTGRTLFGAMPAKGQELEEHYFGALRPEVSAFMKHLDEELWKLGVAAKTKHNEVAPASTSWPHLRPLQCGGGSQSAHHGAHEKAGPSTAWSAFCMKSPSRG